MEYFWRHGVAVGMEVNMAKEANVPRRLVLQLRLGRFFVPERSEAEIVIVFPQGGTPANRPAVFAFLNLMASVAELEIAEKKEAGRTIFANPDRTLNWWQEGDHAVLRIGTDSLKSTFDVMDGRKANLTSTSLYKNLAAFKSYETDIRGLINLEKIIDQVRRPDDADRQIDMIADALVRHVLLHQVGANGVKGLTFHMGFSGKYQRSTVMLHVPEMSERTGLLRALTKVPPSSAMGARNLDLDSLPPLPADAAGVHVLQVDWLSLYDYAQQMVRLLELADALNQGRPPESRLNLDAILNLNFRRDVLATLDSTAVIYGAHSEGPFYLGQGLAIKVKDAGKLRKSTAALNQVLVQSELGVVFQKKTYRGVDMHMLSASPGNLLSFFPFAPTYAIHKDWLVLGVFPQPVKGYILRSEGDRKVWQPPSYARDLLAQCLKEGGKSSRLAGISIVDPAPTFEIGLALLPFVAQIFNAMPNLGRFDVSKIPTAQAVNDFVYPTVRCYFDDGTALRWESHFALDFSTELLVFPLLFSFGIF